MGNHTGASKVILADDDEDDKELFKLALKGAGVQCEVAMVENGQQLLKYLKETPVDENSLLFLDINMPGKNGLTCLEEIKGNKKTEDLPVIIFTTSDHETDITAAYKKGANLYVPKPSSFQTLTKLVKTIFSISADGGFKKPSREKFVMTERNMGLWKM